MGRIKRSIRGIVVVSAATCWFLGAVQPALASTLILSTGPTLTADPTSAYPGDSINISGSSFSQCEKHAIGPNVEVYWDGSDWAQGTVFRAGFSVDVAVPSDSTAGSHQVTAACYDPQAGTVSSPLPASADVQVLSRPALQLSRSEAAAGDGVTVVGTGFGQCAGKGLGDSAQLLWDATPLGGPVGLDGNGAFSVGVTIPAAATAGSGHTVAAECYDPAAGSATSGVLARALFSVTAPTSPTSPTSTTSSPTVIPGHPSTPSGGQWSPVALTAGLGGGLALVVVLLAGLLGMHARARPRNSSWVRQHLRTVGRPLDAAPTNVRIHSRPGAEPVSIGLEPHPDQLGNQQVREITP